MILEITNVQLEREKDYYLVTGKVGTREKTVVVEAFDVEDRLKALGCKELHHYETRDVAPLVAQLATHDLSEALHR